jgi:hypothetical protein
MANFRYRLFMRLVSLYPGYLGAGVRVSYPKDDAHRIVVRNLGPGYLVWDKAAQIEFLRPGRGRVTATFHVPPEKIAEIRAAADRGEKIEPVLVAEVVAGRRGARRARHEAAVGPEEGPR